MDKSADLELKNLINELRLGRELAKQLQIHLTVPSSTHETRELLVHRILNSYEKALTMLKCSTNCTNATGEDQHQLQAQATAAVATIGMLESPRSFSGSPHSEDSDGEFRHQEHKDTSRKRMSMSRWTQQVQVTPGTGVEGPLDDGYTWRKYGQKDILGAKFPRGYYRCTYRHLQGCLATKQVQRSDDDPTIFEIKYRGRHTCSNQPHPQYEGLGSHLTSISVPPENKEQSNMLTSDYQQQFIPHLQPQEQQLQQHSSNQILFNFTTGLRGITEDLDLDSDSGRDHQTLPSYYVPNSTSNIGSNVVSHNHNFRYSPLENDFGGTFISPATSGTNYFSASPSSSSGMINGSGNGGTQQNLKTSESEFADILISAASTSAANDIRTLGLDIPFGQVEFDSNFAFDNPGPGQRSDFFY